MKTLFSIVGLILGAMVDEWAGAVFGFAIGILTGALIQYRNRLRKLEEQVKLIQSGLVDDFTEAFQAEEKQTAKEFKETKETAPVKTPQEPAVPTKSAAVSEEDTDEITLMPPYTSVTSVTETERVDALKKTTPAKPSQVTVDDWTGTAPPGGEYQDKITEFFRRFFTTGNVVVKVGVIILFFGVSFLVKLAAEHNLFPIELRLACVAAGGIVMLIFGWKLRQEKQNYALVLQGGAVAILYLTVFASARLYSVVPMGLAFALMLGLVVFSCIIAVLQDAMVLAIFATAGGFLAPILTSTGAGSHVALFSYYTLLNAGVLGVAWYKSWRFLNWTGFVFTFVIAALWGYRYYQPAYFNTTEPFLVVFFLFYVTIAVLYAFRQPPQLRGLVDGSIVFGTPLVGFTLQSGLVRNFEYGQAWSALAIAAIYIVLARVLWQKRIDGMRMLTEAFLALGIIFASLAIPLTVDGRWTAAAWALEGAGITWIGIRQRRLVARLFGLLLQIGAAVAFLSTYDHLHAYYASANTRFILNSAYIGSVMISLAALFIGLQYYRHRDRLHRAERDAHYVLLVWGLVWWFAAGLVEIDHHIHHRFELNASLFFIATSFWLVFICARALRWPAAEKAPVAFLPVLVLIGFIRFIDKPYTNPFTDFGYAAWIMSFVVQYGLLYRAESSWNRKLLHYWHAITMWAYVFIITWTIGNGISKYIEGMRGWYELWWGVWPTVAIYKVLYMRDRITWPLKRYEPAYTGIGIFPIAVYLAAWIIYMCFQEGNPRPLPYIPVINPQDIAQLLAMLAILDWLQQWQQKQLPQFTKMDAGYFFIALAIVAFTWLNSVVAHCVHFYGGVGYHLHTMARSELFQTSIAIVWTLAALSLMGLSARRGWRRLWFTGAGLLGAVVVKLFLVDLGDSGTVTRIVSFITVGILMLVIGYVSPVPPKQSHG